MHHCITLYTQGKLKQAETAGARGAWAWLMHYGGKAVREDAGYDPYLVAVNQNELKALINGLCAIQPKWQEGDTGRVRVSTRFKMALDALEGDWHTSWQQSNWRSGSNSPIKNRPLWERFFQEVARLEAVPDLTLEWVFLKEDCTEEGYLSVVKLAEEAIPPYPKLREMLFTGELDAPAKPQTESAVESTVEEFPLF